MRFYSTFHIPCMKAARVRNIQGKITVYYRVKKGFCSTFHIPRIKAARVCIIFKERSQSIIGLNGILLHISYYTYEGCKGED